MNAFSNFMEYELLNHVLRGIPSVKRGSFWFALFTGSPGDNGAENEVTGGSYARVELINNKTNFPQCEPGGEPTKTNGESILFPTASATWGTVTDWAAFDAPSAISVASCTTTSGSAIVTTVNTSGLRVGMSMSGSGVNPGGIYNLITAINPGVSFTLTTACTASATVTCTVIPRMIVYGKLAVKRFVKSGKTLKLAGDTLKLTLPQGPVGGFSDWLQRQLLNHVFGHLFYDSPTTIYAGLGLSMSVNELTTPDKIEEWDDASYSRKAITFDAPVNGVCYSSTDMLFTAVDGVTDGAVTLQCFGIWDDDNAGHLLAVGNLRRDVKMQTENLFRQIAGDVTVTLQ